MLAVDNEQMRQLDEATIEKFQPGLVLMERAGQGLFEAVMEQVIDPEFERVAIFLGRGNNAGDGLVLARLLAGEGIGVTLLLMHEPEKFSPDAFKNYSRLQKARGDGGVSEIFLYLSGWHEKVAATIEESTILVDALLGTGINSPVRGNYAEIIDYINGADLLVISADIPSGVNGTTGEVMGRAVTADLTVTFGLPKTGMLFYPGKSHCGAIEIVDIGIPEEVVTDSGFDDHVLDIDQAVIDLPERSPVSHKFQCGRLLVVAGSRRYSGAALLTAVSALRTGCGIVYLGGPESIRTVIQSAAPEIIFLSLPETENGSLAEHGIEAIPGDLEYDALAVGPGMTTDPGPASLIDRLVREATCPVVIDADGINAFAGRFEDIVEASAEKDIVLCPHSGELVRLTGRDIPVVPAERIRHLKELVGGTNITLIHKGAPTVIAHPSGRADINIFGHPGMATAGSGDVLTGAVAGLLSQTGKGGAAARLGVFAHSLAADIAAEDVGERGMTAGDCCDALPLAMKEIEEAVCDF